MFHHGILVFNFKVFFQRRKNDYDDEYIPQGQKKKRKQLDSDSSEEEEDEEFEIHEEEEEDDESLHFSSSDTEVELDSDEEEYVPSGRNAQRVEARKSTECFLSFDFR